ncbi:EF-hand domain-containing protein [Lacimicrobium sp. SS2-24]|uniref:EF-hand domain-containing protein n=1 Tax=Lacimicrobium sp. SS2-24 TaxID=2005569 RepID=UPI000B4B0F17|nr:EF-hand domain-containing protein [Lacimicrobium sp. SS2-24]
MEINTNGIRALPHPAQKPDAQEISTRLLGNLDSNGDKQLSMAEIKESDQNIKGLEKADSDKNGMLSADELLNKVQGLLDKLEDGKPKPPPAHHQGPPSSEQRSAHIMDKADLNADGSIDLAELKEMGKKGAALVGADSDGDGSISADELNTRVTDNLKANQPPAAETHKGDGLEMSKADLIQRLKDNGSEDAKQLLGVLKGTGFNGYA